MSRKKPRKFSLEEGQTFGRLLLLEKVKHPKYKRICWKCLCTCGNYHFAFSFHLVDGYVKSCGCLARDVKLGVDPPNKLKSGQAAFNALYGTYKKVARKRKLDFSLEKEEFKKLTKQNCFYCDKQPSQIQKNDKLNGDYIYNGIDRVDNDKGYILENCVTCCWECNSKKKHCSIDIAYKMIEFIESKKK